MREWDRCGGAQGEMGEGREDGRAGNEASVRVHKANKVSDGV